jgi:AGZA family xanthine/uracil permease-like MFS transporter
MTSNRVSWLSRGDFNAFFGLILDNIAVLLVLLTTITTALPFSEQMAKGQFGFTQEFVLGHMIPGTALGVLVGDLVYTAMAIRLARRTGRQDVTAMPLGLDTPSTFGMAFLVLLPVLRRACLEEPLTRGDHDKAMLFTWHVGVVVLLLVGLIKLLLAPLGNQVRRLIPRAGLLGSLAAIALALIAFLPLVNDGIAGVPIIGMVSLTVILATLIAHKRFFADIPGALAALLLGLAMHGIGMGVETMTGVAIVPSLQMPKIEFVVPVLWPFGAGDQLWWGAVWAEALRFLPVALPFALATVVGGIDCVESAAAAGDEYDTRGVLFTEAVASVFAGFLGGVIQTTPYIGHPAYKKMGARAGYTLATAILVGLGGVTGAFVILEAIPKGALFPILVFVGVEITAASFLVTPARHHAAVALASLPALAAMALLTIKSIYGMADPASPMGLGTLQTLRCMANGFLLTSLLWAAAMAFMIDGRLRMAGLMLLIAAAFSLVGVMHSPLPDERVAWPWHAISEVPQAYKEVVKYQTPWHWSGAYLLSAIMLLALGRDERNCQDPVMPSG